MTTALRRIAVATFEELGFLFVDKETPDAAPPAGGGATVSIRFRGPVQGTLTVRLSAELLPELADNMLGEDEPPSERMQYDALGEIANVICGNVLPSLVGRQEICDLDAPQPAEDSALAQTVAAGAHATRIRIGLEHGYADLLLAVDDEASAGKDTAL